MVSSQQEREDKFDVDLGFVVPQLDDLLPEGGRVVLATRQLENTYYDTAESDLQQLHLTLRRRVGGPDAGWHLKLPSGPARTEIHSGSRARTVPKGLAAPLFGVTRGQELAPIATISTTRDVVQLLDAGGTLLAEVADDQVRSATLGSEATLRSWREVEVELGPAGDEELLTTIGDRLVEWGARRSASVSKLSQALGRVDQVAPEETSVGSVVKLYLGTQVTQIVRGDLGLRLGRPVGHPPRVAVRRLRSTLRVFADVFDPEQAAALESELVWFAGLLGEVRDREVLSERLLRQVGELPPEFVLGPVAAHIESVLHQEQTRHLERALDAMRSDRYLALLDSLHRWRVDPPVTEAAQQGAAELKRYVKKAERKLFRRLATAGGDVEALHSARKAGKRFRYAAELSEPALGKKAAKSVEHGKALQELLGEHQDSVVSSMFLRSQGAAAGADPGQNGFTYGILLAMEWQRAADIRRRLEERFG
ncbi:MAG TPA: CYTH and CHAD domain-containing protein [Propionibacteriaceae bacterium]